MKYHTSVAADIILSSIHILLPVTEATFVATVSIGLTIRHPKAPKRWRLSSFRTNILQDIFITWEVRIYLLSLHVNTWLFSDMITQNQFVKHIYCFQFIYSVYMSIRDCFLTWLHKTNLWNIYTVFNLCIVSNGVILKFDENCFICSVEIAMKTLRIVFNLP